MIRILALCILAGPAFAQVQLPCMARDRMLFTLGVKYSEARQFIGLTTTGLVMEVFASWSGTWTVAITRPDGVMCVLTNGDGFEAMTEVPGWPG